MTDADGINMGGSSNKLSALYLGRAIAVSQLLLLIILTTSEYSNHQRREVNKCDRGRRHEDGRQQLH